MEVRPAYPVDAAWFSTRLRAEDEREIRTASGMEPATVLDLAVESSSLAFVMCPEYGGDPVAIFGVSDDPNETGLGIVWLLATDDVGRHALGVLATARMYVNIFLDTYPEGLHNIVDVRNELHLRWCLMLGFTITGYADLRGHSFAHIYKKAPNDYHV